jgi:ABC-2 type transport system permease protein
VTQWRWEPSPILVKEMRSTMRSGRTFASLTAFLVFLAGLTMLVYFTVTQTYNGRINPSAEAGRTIFSVLSFFELLMLCFVAPAMTAGSVAGEYQRQTFDMLMATPLSTRQVLIGKFLSALSYLFLLMIAAIPINYVAFLFGGVGSDAILWWVGLEITVVFLLGAIGLMMSTIFKSPNIANAATYGTILFFGVIVPILFLFLGISFSMGTNNNWLECTAAALLMFHPGGSLITIISPIQQNIQPLNVLPAALTLYLALGTGCFLIAENRLGALAGRKTRTAVWMLLVALIVVGASAYLIWDPVQTMCLSEF